MCLKGYINRQALYACLTCVPESKEKPEKRAGVCLACSYKCHDGHDLIELYTKRNFRCDCGTSRILAIRCKLDANKMEDNDKNIYNQNFSGVYCTCNRPYPDPEDSTEDEMMQCVLCEDWFHSRHLNTDWLPDSNGFDEMICDSCTTKNEFLNYYSGYCITPKEDANETINDKSVDDASANISMNESAATDISVTDANEASTSSGNEPDLKQPKTEKTEEMLNAELNKCIQDIIDINKSNIKTETECTSKRSNDTGGASIDDVPPNKKFKADIEPSSSNSVCRKPTISLKTFTGASFWPIEWRSKLCKCIKCLEMYRENGVEYLIDEHDTVHAYQEKGKAKAANQATISEHDQTMSALSGMDRVAQIEAIMAYNKLKQKLTEFLTSFVANQQVVTTKDVDTFFQSMTNNKKKD